MQELQKRFPNNRVLIDVIGNPSVTVFIEKFYLDEVIDHAPHIPHPAFVVNGTELDGIYLSKFQNVLKDGYACSLPDVDPTTHIDFDTAVDCCAKKGSGFHLMTAMEWGAVALLSQKNGWYPLGNNDMGKDIHESEITAKITYYNEEKAICRVATGSGPVTWSHNQKEDGIYDLNANVWEWSAGIRLVFGELQVLPDNNAASDLYSQSATSADWRAIDAISGEYLIPDQQGTTPNSVKLDFVNDTWQFVSAPLSDPQRRARFCAFSKVSAHESLGEKAKILLLSLGILPLFANPNCEGVASFANNGAPERMLFRGGRWGQGYNAGIFKNCFDDPRTYAGDAVGFRMAYYEKPTPKSNITKV